MTSTTPETNAPTSGGGMAFLKSNLREYGLLISLVIIMVFFQVKTDGTLFQPLNLTNLILQNSYIIVMALGMLLVIVAGHIDLSVGSVCGFIGAVAAVLMVNYNWHYVPAAIVCLILGGVIGAAQGYWVAFYKIPSFIVTLGGLFVWRNVNWFTTNGQSVSLTDPNLLLFGGTEGVLGAPVSMILGVVTSVAAVMALYSARKNKLSHGFVVKPLWAEGVMMGLVAGAIMFFVTWLSRYPVPAAKLKRQIGRAHV